MRLPCSMTSMTTKYNCLEGHKAKKKSPHRCDTQRIVITRLGFTYTASGLLYSHVHYTCACSHEQTYLELDKNAIGKFVKSLAKTQLQPLMALRGRINA